MDRIRDKLRSLRIDRLYKRYQNLKNIRSKKMKDKLDRIRKTRLQRRLLERLMITSQSIGRASRRGAGNFIVTSPEIANYFNIEWLEKNITGTQSND